VLTYPVAGNVDGTKGSAYAEATVNVIDTASNQGVIDIAGAGNRPLFTRKSSDNKLAYYDGTNDISTGFTWNDTLKRKMALSWGGSNAKAFMNGTADTARAFDGDFNASVIDIGRQVATGYLYGTIRNVKIWKKALTDTQLTNMTSTNTAVAQSAVRKKTIKVTQSDKFTNGLVGMWSFNGPDMSGNTAIDRSGMGNNGTTTGGVRVVLGKNGQALQFDGTSGYVSVGDTSSLNATTAFTVSAWVYKTGNSSGSSVAGTIAGKWNSSGTGWFLELHDTDSGTPNQLRFYISGVSTASTYSVGQVSNNAWHHILVKYDGVKKYIYIDGTLDTSPDTTGTPTTANDSFQIGFDTGSAASFNYFNGKIDEVRIYNRALSANEVTQLYNLGR
jgi:hypothetical protein